MAYKQTHTIELSIETLLVKPSLGTDGRRLILVSEDSSKAVAINKMDLFLDSLKKKLDQERED